MVPMLDLKNEFQTIKKELLDTLTEILESSQ